MARAAHKDSWEVEADAQEQQDRDTDYGREKRIKEAVQALIGELEQEADDRVNKRRTLEKRWLEDLRQYYGEYDEKTAKNLEKGEQSKLFLNLTRPKTAACEARLGDMLFPADDRNWGIEPTPVPRLSQTGQRAAEAATEQARQANEAMQAQDPAAEQAALDQGNEAAKVAAEANAISDEARKRAAAMQDEIEDQLRECDYNIQSREVIHDACQLGTGVMKGPVARTTTRGRWKEAQATDGRKMHVLENVADPRPAFYRVDLWSFFPDRDARTMDENEAVFERHLMTKKELRKLAQQPDYDKDAIRELLQDAPRASTPTYIADLRSIMNEQQADADERYHVWEYHGPITAEQLEAVAEYTGNGDMVPQKADPLDAIEVVIWFCQGRVLKFGIHHLDSGESIYSVYTLEKDESSVFGLGIPAIMRAPQKALNAAWRMMMDNSGLTTGPQIAVNRSVVEPADGEWSIRPLKLWLIKADADKNAKAFEAFSIDSHQAELANIIEMAKQFIDDETSISTLAQGEQGTHTTQTLGGMSILMNSTNTSFRRMVKNFDDQMTVPNLRRSYDWNMQFSPRDEVKGDYEIDARGSSVLLVREMQTQNLMVICAQFLAHPVLAGLLKAAPAVRKLFQTMMIKPDELVMTDEEIKQAQQAAAQGQQEDPEMAKLRVQQEIAKADNEARIQIAEINREAAAMKVAAEQNMTVQQVQAAFAGKKLEIESKERIFAAEAAVEARKPAEAKGSGGYLA